MSLPAPFQRYMTNWSGLGNDPDSFIFDFDIDVQSSEPADESLMSTATLCWVYHGSRDPRRYELIQQARATVSRSMLAAGDLELDNNWEIAHTSGIAETVLLMAIDADTYRVNEHTSEVSSYCSQNTHYL